MKLKYKFAVVQLKDKFVAVANGEDSGKYSKGLKVNEYGMMIIKALKKDVSREYIIEKLQSYFEGDDKLEEKIDAFLQVLRKENLLIE